MGMEAKNRRVEMLLKVRRQEEEAARRAFDEANARANFHRERMAETERLLVEHGQAARRDLVGSPAQPSPAGPAGAVATAGYRALVVELRSAMGEQSALLRQLDPMLRNCRQELLEAMNRRKLAETLRDRLVRGLAEDEEQAETARLDEAHAVRQAGVAGSQ